MAEPAPQNVTNGTEVNVPNGDVVVPESDKGVKEQTNGVPATVTESTETGESAFEKESASRVAQEPVVAKQETNPLVREDAEPSMSQENPKPVENKEPHLPIDEELSNHLAMQPDNSIETVASEKSVEPNEPAVNGERKIPNEPTVETEQPSVQAQPATKADPTTFDPVARKEPSIVDAQVEPSAIGQGLTVATEPTDTIGEAPATQDRPASLEGAVTAQAGKVTQELEPAGVIDDPALTSGDVNATNGSGVIEEPVEDGRATDKSEEPQRGTPAEDHNLAANEEPALTAVPAEQEQSVTQEAPAITNEQPTTGIGSNEANGIDATENSLRNGDDAEPKAEEQPQLQEAAIEKPGSAIEMNDNSQKRETTANEPYEPAVQPEVLAGQGTTEPGEQISSDGAGDSKTGQLADNPSIPQVQEEEPKALSQEAAIESTDDPKPVEPQSKPEKPADVSDEPQSGTVEEDVKTSEPVAEAQANPSEELSGGSEGQPKSISRQVTATTTSQPPADPAPTSIEESTVPQQSQAPEGVSAAGLITSEAQTQDTSRETVDPQASQPQGAKDPGTDISSSPMDDPAAADTESSALDDVNGAPSRLPSSESSEAKTLNPEPEAVHPQDLQHQTDKSALVNADSPTQPEVNEAPNAVPVTIESPNQKADDQTTEPQTVKSPTTESQETSHVSVDDQSNISDTSTTPEESVAPEVEKRDGAGQSIEPVFAISQQSDQSQEISTESGVAEKTIQADTVGTTNVTQPASDPLAKPPNQSTNLQPVDQPAEESTSTVIEPQADDAQKASRSASSTSAPEQTSIQANTDGVDSAETRSTELQAMDSNATEPHPTSPLDAELSNPAHIEKSQTSPSQPEEPQPTSPKAVKPQSTDAATICEQTSAQVRVHEAASIETGSADPQVAKVAPRDLLSVQSDAEPREPTQATTVDSASSQSDPETNEPTQAWDNSVADLKISEPQAAVSQELQVTGNPRPSEQQSAQVDVADNGAVELGERRSETGSVDQLGAAPANGEAPEKTEGIELNAQGLEDAETVLVGAEPTTRSASDDKKILDVSSSAPNGNLETSDMGTQQPKSTLDMESLPLESVEKPKSQEKTPSPISRQPTTPEAPATPATDVNKNDAATIVQHTQSAPVPAPVVPVPSVATKAQGLAGQLFASVAGAALGSIVAAPAEASSTSRPITNSQPETGAETSNPASGKKQHYQTFVDAAKADLGAGLQRHHYKAMLKLAPLALGYIAQQVDNMEK